MYTGNNTFTWNQTTQYPLTGYFPNSGDIYGVGENQSTYLRLITPGALLKFTDSSTMFIGHRLKESIIMAWVLMIVLVNQQVLHR